jgi:uncharacterized protein YlxP (DUF503 family)
MIAMSKAQEIRAYLIERNPEALYIGDNEEHDSALIGIARIMRDDVWVEVTMYSYDELILSFTEQFRETESEDPEYDPEQDAVEWVDYNVTGAYVGIYTPFIVYN